MKDHENQSIDIRQYAEVGIEEIADDAAELERMLTATGEVLRDSESRPLLTKEEEVALAKAIEAGDTAAREKLISSNTRLVISIARNKLRKLEGLPFNISMDDAVQNGMLGLITAVDRYNWRKGTRFATYATYLISEAIADSITYGSQVIRIPEHVIDLIVNLKRISALMEEALGRPPREEELLRYFEGRVSARQIKNALRIINDGGASSLDVHLSGDAEDNSRTFGDTIADERATREMDEVIRKDEISSLQEAIASLSEREQIVVKMCFGVGGETMHCLDDIARELYNRGYRNAEGNQMSRVAVHHIKERALKHLRPLLQG